MNLAYNEYNNDFKQRVGKSFIKSLKTNMLVDENDGGGREQFSIRFIS
jgi:hypothetical protein